MTTIDRINDLTIESTNTLLDAVLQAQSQSVTVAQSIVSTLEQNQKANRNLITSMFRQAQEAQKLWIQLAQESTRTTTETFTRLGREQVSRATETFSNAAAETNNVSRRAAGAANSK
ncbi:MAG: hypothetical protein NVSMB22_25050 [Chloroflexota bacterium]